jgi:hypothetical protein
MRRTAGAGLRALSWVVAPVAAGLALAVLGAAYGGTPALVLVLLVIQVAFSVGWFSAVGLPSSGVLILAVTVVALAADLATSVSGRRDLQPLAAVLGPALLAAIVAALVRSERVRVTEALSVTLAAAYLAAAGAAFITVRHTSTGRDSVLSTLAATTAALVVARSVGAVGLRPPAAVLTGPALAAAAGAAAGSAVTAFGGGLSAGEGAGVGLAAAVVTVLASMAAAYPAASLARGALPQRRRGTALAAATLPVLVVGPVAFAAVRVIGG